MTRPLPACKKYDPEIWFPVGNGPRAHVLTEVAKQICASCPLLVPCREWATETNPEYGIWGGLSEEDRRIQRRRGMLARRIPDARTTSLVRALASQA